MNPTTLLCSESPPCTDPRRRGTAMMEMCLVLPVLFLIISLIFFFGRGLMRLQFTEATGRYVAWQNESGGPGPGADPAALNLAFDQNKATTVGATVNDAFPADAANMLEGDCTQYSSDAQQLMTQSFGDFPKGSSADATATYTSGITYWQKLERPLEHPHTRLGNDWKFANGWSFATGDWKQAPAQDPWMLQPATQVFFQNLDGNLVAIPNNSLATTLRVPYSGKPGYVGPDLGVGPLVQPGP